MPAMGASSWAAPNLLLLLLLLLIAASESEAATINITNGCSYTVWPAAMGLGSRGGGRELRPGQVWALDVPTSTTSGRIWARSGCWFGGDDTNGSCQTGDCGGALACNVFGKQPTTVAEFTTNGTRDFFDISVIDGFNMPMDFLPVPVQGQKRCGSTGPWCAADIASQCPGELKVPGGCKNPCTGRNGSSGGNCASSGFFKRMCPDARSLPDGDHATHTCLAGTDYQVTFCPPPTSLAVSRAVPSPPPAPTESVRKRSRTVRVLVIVSTTVTAIFVTMSLSTMLFLLTFYVHKQRALQCQLMEEDEEFGQLQGTPMKYTFHQLEAATGYFRHKLGEGGFGSVFEGWLGGERIAVKRLDQAGQGKKEFSAEVHTISSIHHINLVKLVGFCAEKSQRFLVYEYMPKGSLDRWIYCRHDNGAPLLDWSTRCKIITHIAKGLSYLHEECTKRIAHLDVKPQNILLDDDFNAKISDFGLCKLIDRDMSQVVTRMRGTPGYLAPEWLTSQITEKADVYSFGVMVMEILSGRKNLDTSRSEESIHLITQLEEKVKTDRLVDLIDNNSKDMLAHEQDVIQMMMLAMWCLQIDCKNRPKMSEVVKVLEGAMKADSSIHHNFVAKSPPNFRISGNASCSAPPLASEVSGPR